MADDGRAEGEATVGSASAPPAVAAPPGAEATAESTPPSDGARTEEADTRLSTLSARINDLKRVQAEMALSKKKAASELRNLERKRGRLAKKARLLSDDDLLLVLKLRQERSLERAAASGSGSTAATSEASSPPEEGR